MIDISICIVKEKLTLKMGEEKNGNGYEEKKVQPKFFPCLNKN